MTYLIMFRRAGRARRGHVAFAVTGDQGTANVAEVRSALAKRRSLDRPGGIARVSQRLAPVPESIPVGRWLTVQACDRWGIRSAVEPAGQVVTELVGNAVEHAGTPLDLVLTRLRPYLHIAVRDGCRRLPRQRAGEPDHDAGPGVGAPGDAGSNDTGPNDAGWNDDGSSVEDGLGMLVVEAFANRHGATRTRDGKVVWATVRAP